MSSSLQHSSSGYRSGCYRYPAPHGLDVASFDRICFQIARQIDRRVDRKTRGKLPYGADLKKHDRQRSRSRKHGRKANSAECLPRDELVETDLQALLNLNHYQCREQVSATNRGQGGAYPPYTVDQDKPQDRVQDQRRRYRCENEFRRAQRGEHLPEGRYTQGQEKEIDSKGPHAGSVLR